MLPRVPFSIARAFFEKIDHEADPFVFLSDSPLRAEPFFEEEWLDFKGNPRDERDAKRIWSKALSGYANTADGLIIWGIDARKTPPRNIDAASALRLIPDPHAFESQLRDWIRDATNPPVMGVEYQSYVGPAGEGFVVCLIPESTHKPHRAEFADKHYYYRAGDDFLSAEPGLLRMLFYPQLQPYLWVDVSCSFDSDPVDLSQAYRQNPNNTVLFNKWLNSQSNIRFDAMLHNTGTATAKAVYIIVQASADLNVHPGGDWRIRYHPRGQGALEAARSVHPGEITELCGGNFQQMFPNRTLKPDNCWEIVPHFDKVQLRFLIYAENLQPTEISMEFVPEDFVFETGSATKKGLPIA